MFGFREIRYFDIKGEYTGLSKAMTAPDGKIRIPLNEEGKGGGQIEEFCAPTTARASSTSPLPATICWRRGTGSRPAAPRS
jgi:hypothetical protein